MARQKGLIRIQGTLDGITFYKTPDGNLVRTAGGIDKKRIATDPGFARTRAARVRQFHRGPGPPGSVDVGNARAGGVRAPASPAGASAAPSLVRSVPPFHR